LFEKKRLAKCKRQMLRGVLVPRVAARLTVVARKMKGKGEERRDNEAREEWDLLEVVLRLVKREAIREAEEK
jgi:hypothetical protein